jgi:hypothetical protein
MKHHGGRNRVDWQALDVSKSLLGPPREESDLGQMEVSFSVTGINPEHTLQEALGALHPLGSPFDLRLEQQLVAPHSVDLPRLPLPKPLSALPFLRVPPPLVGHVMQVSAISAAMRSQGPRREAVSQPNGSSPSCRALSAMRRS